MSQHHFSPGNQSQDVLSASNENIPILNEAAQMEADKQLIKSHPLFLLLKLLFEKCERVTRGEEIPVSATYDEEIQEFIRRRETSMTPIFIDNPEIDNLMIKAIQVLRIHLLELEKVNELCKDFCHRYITCLKGKMHSENLLRSDSGYFSDPSAQHSMLQASTSQSMANTPNANVTVNQNGDIVMQSGIFQHSIPADGQVVQSENGIDGSTPLSQVGVSPAPQEAHSMASQLYHMHHQGTSGMLDDPNNRKTKRGILPKHATEILRSWLFSHIVHPYPTEDEKRTLANQTNLTLLQVNNWFINARRRILQPMLDASNQDVGSSSSANKNKKTKTQANRASDRFWPNAVAPNETNGDQPHEEAEVESSIQELPSIQNRSHLIDHQSCTQEVRGPNQGVEGYRGHSPQDLDQSPNQLRHYSHGDVAMTSSCSHVPLSMVNN